MRLMCATVSGTLLAGRGRVEGVGAGWRRGVGVGTWDGRRRTGLELRGDDPGIVPGAAGITSDEWSGKKVKEGKTGERGRKEVLGTLGELAKEKEGCGRK